MCRLCLGGGDRVLGRLGWEHVEEEDRGVEAEVLDLFGDNGRDARGSDLAAVGKVTAFVVEHLRLHPPIFFFDVLYIALVYRRCRREGINPWRRP